MTKKQYLRQGYILKQKISIQEALLKEYKANLDSLKGINYSKDKLQGGPVQDDSIVIRKIDKIIEVEKNITRLHNELDIFQNNISLALKKINSDIEEKIIVYRYINNLSWEEISKNIGYSKTQTYRLHEQALEKLKIF